MDGSQPLQNPKHERFALLVATGETSAAEAYRQEVGKKASKATIETEGPSLARSPQVALRISWLRSEADKRARELADDTVMTIVEKRQFLARVKRAHGAKLDEKRDADLIQGLKFDKWGNRILEIPDKIAAIKLDNDLAGDGSEAKGHSAIAELVSRIRR